MSAKNLLVYSSIFACIMSVWTESLFLKIFIFACPYIFFFLGGGGWGLGDGHALVALQIETDFCEWSLDLNICWKHTCTVNNLKNFFLTTDF